MDKDIKSHRFVQQRTQIQEKYKFLEAQKGSAKQIAHKRNHTKNLFNKNFVAISQKYLV